MNKTQWKNAKKCVEQIKRGEWIPKWNTLAKEYLLAERDGKTLWIGNGPWFTDIDDKNYFGMIFRHYVWWVAASGLHNTPGPKLEKETPVLED